MTEFQESDGEAWKGMTPLEQLAAEAQQFVKGSHYQQWTTSTSSSAKPLTYRDIKLAIQRIRASLSVDAARRRNRR